MPPDYRGIALTKLLREQARHLLSIAQAFDDAKPIPTFKDLLDDSTDWQWQLHNWSFGHYDSTLGNKP